MATPLRFQAEDDLFKIAHFEKTLAYIKKSSKYKNLSLQEQKKVAIHVSCTFCQKYEKIT